MYRKIYLMEQFQTYPRSQSCRLCNKISSSKVRKLASLTIDFYKQIIPKSHYWKYSQSFSTLFSTAVVHYYLPNTSLFFFLITRLKDFSKQCSDWHNSRFVLAHSVADFVRIPFIFFSYCHKQKKNRRDLSQNSLSGTIPDLSSLTLLQTL